MSPFCRLSFFVTVIRLKFINLDLYHITVVLNATNSCIHCFSLLFVGCLIHISYCIGTSKESSSLYSPITTRVSLSEVKLQVSKLTLRLL